ncbi:MAG TPA: peptide ABC transporter permease [Bdellovibrionales bacterium]|nr:peptide ABC transporter permease [Pseudobdellovibrionaceae bacterium]HAG91896.1 peptide ABC transporter permease [Bdellovibrionales bacterium]
MISYFLKRVLQAIPTFLLVSVFAFGVIRLLPGDPVLLMLGERGGSPELVAEMRAQLGLDQPLPVQYFKFLKGSLQGNFGESIVSNRPVTEEFFGRFPATAELGVLALLFAVLVGIPLGIVAAMMRGKIWDRVLMGVSLFGYSMPIFWWGLLMILLFSVHLGWTPVSGRISPMYDVEPWSGFLLIDVWVRDLGGEGFFNALKYLILPSFVLGTVPMAAIARMTRSSLLEVLKEDYVRTAQAKGLGPFQVVVRHALSNAMIPIVTVAGLMLGTILTGAVLTESIFSWPGIGKWLVSSVIARDYPVIQGGILLISGFVISINILVDTLYLYLNPKMREAQQ